MITVAWSMCILEKLITLSSCDAIKQNPVWKYSKADYNFNALSFWSNYLDTNQGITAKLLLKWNIQQKLMHKRQ